MIQNQFNEKIVYNNPLQPVRILHETRNSVGSGPWHYHNELELIAVINGEFCIYAKELAIELSSGNVAIIGSYEPHHSYKKAGSMEYLVLQFDIFRYISQDLISYMKYFTEAGRLLSRLNYIFREQPEVNKKIYEYMLEICSEYEQKQKGYEIAIHSLIHRIILTLLRNDTSTLLDINTSVELEKLLPVLEYIEKNIDGKINMEDASKLMNLDYSYFGKYFKKVTGKSFKEYINQKKIINSERILLTKNVSITEVASLVGMPNMANFYKVFKAYNNCSPKEWRQVALNNVKGKPSKLT